MDRESARGGLQSECPPAIAESAMCHARGATADAARGKRTGRVTRPAPAFTFLHSFETIVYCSVGSVAPSGTNHTSTRRFCAIEAMSLPVAMGWLEPAERVVIRAASMPAAVQ